MNNRSMRRTRGERHTSNVSVMSSATSEQQQHSFHAYSSMSTLSGAHSLASLARAPIMQASEIKELLQQRVAFLSGAKDRSGGPIIVFPKHTENISIEDIASVLSYLATIPSKESRQRGFVIILDVNQQTGESIKALCRVIQDTLPNKVHRVIVLKQDLLWERQLRRDPQRYGFEVVTVSSIPGLTKFIDTNQLTQDYGGTLRYNHEEWVDNRLDYEKFLTEAALVQQRFDRTDEDIARYHEFQDTSESRLRYSQRIKENVVNQPSWVLQLGNALLRRLREDAGFKRTEVDRELSTEDHQRMQDHVEKLMRKLQERQREMKNYLAQRDVHLGLAMDLEEMEGGIKRVVDWIVGPGEKLLMSQKSIGRDFPSADQLRRDHEKFELKCTDTYGNYAELRHTATDFIKQGHPKADDIDAQKEYMDTVCRSFASRLERRRNMVICSTRFHRFAEDAFQSMDTITQICQTEIPVESVQEAEAALQTLTQTQENASYLTDRAIHEGKALLEMLGLQTKNAFGRDVTPDYTLEVEHVKDLIARLQGMKASSEDLVRIRHLKLKQIIQLRTCEKDTEQAIMWLLELVEVMISQHVDIGHSPQEAEQLKKEHEKFGFTARESYEYGKELVKTSLGLRRSLKLDLRPNYDKAQRLESAWHQFSQALSERASRLTVSLMFHRNVDKLIFEINQLCQEVAPRVADSNPQVVERVLGRFEPRRQALLKDYNDTMAMGQALLNRIALPVVAPDRAFRQPQPSPSQDAQGALLAQRLHELDAKKREMDILWGIQVSPEGTEPHRVNSRRRVPDWEVVARMQEGDPKRRGGSQGGRGSERSFGSREPERINVTQLDQQQRMPPRQVQEPDLIVPIQQSTQFSAPPPPPSQQLGPGGVPRSRPDSRSSQGSRSSLGFAGRPIQPGPPLGRKDRPDSRSSQGYPGKVMNGHIPGQQPGEVRSPARSESVTSQDDAQRRFEEWQAKVNESGDWIEVQVQEMKPKLAEIGKTLEEAERYQQEHDEMTRKIAAKQPEIAALLSQADFNISTQQFYNDVYEAMAHSLGEAWRDLNRLLEKRKQLLADAVNFHKNINDVSAQMDSAAAQFKDPNIPPTPEEVDKLLQDHDNVNQDLLEKSIAVVTDGQALLEKVKEIGEKAPKEETEVTLAASSGIQQAVEDLMHRRKLLDDLLSQKKKRLNQYATVGELDKELSKVSDWFEKEGEAYLQRRDIGSDPQATEELMKEHDKVENAAKKVRESVDRVLAESEELEHSDPEATDKLRDQTRAISILCDEFMKKLDDRKRTLQATLDFYNNHDLAMNYLNRLDVQLSNLPQDPNARAQRIQQLESAIPEITNPVARQGSALLARVGRNVPGAFGIERRLTEMQDKAQELEAKCHPEIPQRVTLRAAFNDKHRNLVEWMVNGVDPYLDANNDMGDQLKTTTDFSDGHQKVLNDLKGKSNEIKVLLNIPNQLATTGDSDLATVQQRADEVESYWTELSIRVETRVKTSSTLIKFEKLAKQLGNGMDTIDDLFETVENQQAHQVTEAYISHIREKWDYMVEVHFQLDSSGRNFLNEASQITNDPNLEIKRSSYYVDMTMKGFDERRRKLDAKYEILLQNLDLDQTFRSEWNQFLEDARDTIRWVSKAEADFFKDMTRELNMSPEKVRTLQVKLEQFQPTVKKATGEIEQHLTKAELLSRRGDVGDEKQLIVDELTAVHKRLTNKVTTHQVLLTLIIKFYENIGKLNKDMDKSEKQYTTAPMPDYISEAHVELQLHDDERGILNELYNATNKEGDEILNRMRSEPSTAPLKPEIEDALANIKNRRIKWLSEWEQRRLRLEAFIGTDHLKSFRHELNVSLDDAEDELRRRKGNYGDSPESARELLKKEKQLEPQLKELGDKVNEYKSSAYLALKQGEDPDGELKKDVEDLDKRWSTFCMELDDHRDKLEKAVQFQDLYKEATDWQDKGNDLVDNINKRLAECKSPEEVNPLLEEVDDFLEKEAPTQNARLSKLNQLAADIYGPDAPTYMSELLLDNNKLMEDLQDTNDELYQLADDLAKPRGRRPEKRRAGEDLTIPDGVISPDPAKQSKFPDMEQPLQEAPSSMEESAPPPLADEGQITPTHLTPVKAGMPLDQLDESMEAEPYEPLLPHQSQSVPYAVGSAVLDEYLGPSKPRKKSPEKGRSPGKKGSAPFFPRVIRDLTVKEGRLATFDCIVKGEPEPDIIWMKDGVQLRESREAIVEYGDDDSCTLVLPAIQFSKAGKYTCKATNIHGQATCSAELTVRTDKRLHGMNGPQFSQDTPYSPSEAKPPRFVEAPKDQTAEEGKPCRISCEIEGVPPPVVTWSKDGDPLSEDACRFQQEGQVYTLILDDTVLDDEGFYACTAVNPKGRAEKMFHIKVKEAGEAPKFVGPLIDTTADDGTCVQLKCRVQGARPMKVLWHKYDIHLTPSSMYHMSYNETTGECMLEIVIVGRNDEGEFLCRAENEFGRAETTAELIVEGPEPVPYAPKVTAPLKDVEVTEGDPWELKCSIAAYPRPTLTWYKNDQPIVVKPPLDTVHKGRTAKLLVPASLMEDKGKYTVRAVNPLGEVSTSGFIDVKKREIPPSPPRFSRMLEPQTIIEGKPLELKCTLTGYPQPEITWYRNNRPFPQEIPHDTWYRGGEAALRIPKATADDDGIYTCKAVNPHGQDSTSGRVMVEEPATKPVFTTKLEPEVTVPKGKPLHLKCKLDSSPNPTITWYHNGTLIPDEKPYEMYHTGDEVGLVIPQSLKNDEGMYACRAATPAGEDMTNSKVTVKEHIKPQFTTRLQPQMTVTEGEPLELVCSATGDPTPTIQWYKDGKLLDRQGGYNTTFAGGEARLTTLRTEPGDEGVFSCRAVNPAGDDITSCNVVVEEPEPPETKPHFLSRLEPELTLPHGKPLFLKCKVDGYPPPKVAWYKDGVPISPASPVITFLRDGEASLEIPQADERDSGVYSCLASNPMGQDSTSCNVTVSEPEPPPSKPHFISRLPFELKLPHGDPLYLKCLVEGNPTPNINWFKDGIALKKDPRYQIDFKDGEASLKVPQSVQDDGGVYSCLATNPSGQDSTTSNVTVGAQEPPPCKPQFVSRLAPELTIPHGEPLNLNCGVEGYPPPKVMWYKDGIPLKDKPDCTATYQNGEASLDKPQCSEDDGGVYSCVASNPSGKDSTSCNVLVSAPEPPPSKPNFISRLVTDLSIPHREPLVLKAVLEGYPVPNINWFKDGTLLKNEPRYEQNFSNGVVTLKVAECVQDDGGVFSCLATNLAGQDSTSCNVTVGAPEPPPSKPHFVSRLEPELDLTHGLPLVLKCKVGGYPPPKMTWYKDGIPLKNEEPYQITDKDGSSTLVVPQAQEDDGGVYSCVAANPSGQDTTSCNVSVAAPEPPPSKPLFISRLEPELALSNGEPLVLKCKVGGYPPPKTTWYKDGISLKPGHPYEIGGRNGDSYLKVPQAVEDDGGVYSCLATNPSGQDSTSCNVTVSAPEPPPSKPHFTSRLEPELSIPNGETLALKCKVGGYPPPKTTWYKDGVPLKNEPPFEITSRNGETCLKVPQAEEDDGGVYSCLATNPSGQDSTSANVTVAAPEPPPSKPHFISRLEPEVTIPHGETLNLKCKVGGYPPPKMTWYIDGTPLKNVPPYEISSRGGEASLKIPQAVEDDGGVYSCVATNPSGQDATNSNVTVEAPEPPPSKPHFTSRLEPELSLANGEPLVLKCKVGGYPPPKTTWYKDGVPLKNEAPFEISTRGGEVALQIPDTMEDDGGVYSCLATNPSGQDSTSCNVTVAAPEPPPSKPLFISRLEPDLSLANGEPLLLKCKVGGYPPPKITWYKDGNPLKNEVPYEISTRGGETSLKIPDSVEEDGGVYSCSAVNPSGQDSTSCNVTVAAPEPPPSKPHFTSRLEPEFSLANGEPLVLKCKVGGYPPPKTTWYKDGVALKNELPYEITSKGGEATLRIPDTMEDDGGVYSCLATNPSGQDSTSCNVSVAVPEPPPSKPHFTSRLEPEVGLENGEPLVLKCKVGGYPPPKTTWYKDGVPLKNEPPFEISSRGGESTLKIPETMDEDGGVYSCLAANPSGQDATSCNVTVAAPEPPPSKPHFTSRLEPELSLANREPLLLKCKVRGYPPPKTTWYKDGVPLKNELPYEITSKGGDATLRIPDTMEDDGGVYSCLATNPSGQDSTSCNVMVAAPEPPPSKPHFTTRLEPEHDLDTGQPLVLKCKVGGYPPPKTTWYKDGVPLKNEPPYEITSKGGEAILQIPETMDEDSGVYSCLAANPSGQDATSCNLSVAAPEPPPSKPLFISRLEPDLSLANGEPLILKCKVRGYPPPKTAWYKDSVVLSNEPPYEIVAKGGEASLKIPETMEDDGGVYLCLAANPSGQDSTSCNVTVAAPEPPPSKPHFTSRLEPELSLANGEPLVLKCKVGGYPPPKTTWYKDGVPLKNELPYEITSKGGEATLRIPDTMEDDGGVYSCLATNPSGQDSTSCNISVAAPEPPPSKPHFTSRLEPEVGLENGEPLLLKCKVGGYPIPKIIWYKDGNPLKNELPYEISTRGGESSLKVPETMEEDGGVYSCVAANPSGQDTSSCNVMVAAPEPPPSKPHFISRLEPVVDLTNGEPLMLKCKVGGYPPPKTLWYKDGVQLKNEAPYELTSYNGEQTLAVPETQEEDGGVYSCLATNPSGQDSTSANVTVAAPEPPPSKPHFTSRLEPDLSLPNGEPLVLKCKVGGYPPPKTVWYKDGTQLRNEAPYEIVGSRGGEQKLTVPQAEVDDSGVYSCLASNPSGQDSTSSNVTVAAAEPPPSKPHFTTRLEPEYSLPDGEPMMLKCKVGGYPPPKTLWYKDGTQLKNEPPYEISTRGGEQTLKIPQAEEDDGGVYSCLATNPSGQDSTSTNITVAAPQPPPSKPHFTSRLEPELNLYNGEPLALKCKVGGYPPPKITWYKDGTPLKNEHPYEISSRGGESTLAIPQTEQEDGGIYTCQATNPSGQESTSSNVAVAAREPPPSKPHFITRLEPELNLPSGEPLALKCKVGGYPPPKTIWYKDGVQLRNEPPYEITSRGNEVTLKIPQSQDDDSGVYSCLATNPSGQDSTSANVTVAEPEPPPSKPHFTSRLEPEIDQPNGEPLVLKCKVGGYPPPKTTWYKDGIPLRNEHPYEISSRGGESILKIPEAQEEDSGVYSCMASNPTGQDSTSANVTIAAPEPPPSKPHFTSGLEPELSLENGEPLLLKCRVSGYPQPKTMWYKDGTPLQNAAPYEIASTRSGESSLHIPEADEVDGGVYSCLATNPAGQDSTSCNVSVAAPEPPPSKPHFLSRFEPEMRLPDGEPLVLKCKVEGYPPPKVTWYKDGTQLKNEPHHEITSKNGDVQLRVPDAQEDDGGVYSCLITNPSGQESASCNVAVAAPEPPPSKPHFTLKLAPNLSFPPGEPIFLRCKVAGYPPPKATWYKDGIPLKSEPLYEIGYRNGECTFRIPEGIVEDGGVYSCLASNPSGQETTTANVVVKAPEPPPSKPHFVTRLAPELNITGGEAIVLKCKVGGYPLPKLSWFKDSEQVPSEPPYEIESREGEGMLRIPESAEDDGGVYSCLAVNPSGQDSTSCSVLVTAREPPPSKPHFTLKLAPEVIVSDGEQLALKCRVGGYPLPRTAWYKDGSIIPNEPPYQITFRDGDSSLVVPESTEENSGVYSCQATNSSGQESTSSNVVVSAPEPPPSKPHFTSQLPAEFKVPPEEPLLLKCKVGGYPPPKVTWYKDGAPLKNEPRYVIGQTKHGEATLHVPQTAEDDSGVYSCLASNPSGQESCSTNVTIAALEPPSSRPLFVTRLSPELGVLSGEPVLLKCKVGGYPPPKTAWYKDGVQLRNEHPYEIISKGGEHTLQIGQSGDTDSGAYTCIATNPSGQDKTSCNLSVTATEPPPSKPHFNSKLEPELTIPNSEPIILKCKVGGYPPPNLSWYKDGVPLKNNPEVEITTKGGESTLRVPDATEANSGAYSCLASNPTGQESQSCNVLVSAPEPPPSKPHFTTRLVPELPLAHGETLNLSAKVTGYPPPRITWYKDGTPLKSGPDYKLVNNNGAVSLQLPKCYQDDGGVYACLATNPSGQDSTSSNVTVSAPEPPPSKPRFTSRLAPQIQLPHGEPLVLKTKVDGYPVPKITWYKDGVPLKNEPSSEISFKNGEATLRVPQTMENDGGVYSCVASNPSGQDTTNCNVSCAAPEPPQTKPFFSVKLEPSLTVPQGETVELKCKVNAYPVPRIAWLKEDVPLQNVPPYQITYLDGEAVLRIPECQAQDEGAYTCQAFNSMGQDMTECQLSVAEPELPPAKPHFTEGLEPQVTIPVDEPLLLTCKVAAHPPPQITWYRNGTPIRNEPQTQVSYRNGEASLKIPRCSKADAGMYSCLATNPHGNETSSCNVNIAVPSKPNFVTRLQQQISLPKGEPLFLQCHVVGHPTPFITWFKDGMQIRNEPPYEMSFIDGEAILKMSEFTRKDDGVYSCQATNVHGKDSTSGQVEQLEPKKPSTKPRFTAQLKPEINVPVGSPIELACRFTGHPAPTPSWYKDDRPLANEPPIQLTYKNGEAALKIPESFEEDQGIYQCKAVNPVGEDVSKCRVVVSALKIPPRFTAGLEPRLSVPQGAPIELNCSAIGQPTPTLSWYKDNRPLRNEHPYSIRSDDGDGSLRIEESKKVDAGTYSCRAQNPQGEDTTSCKVHIEVTPVFPPKIIPALSDHLEVPLGEPVEMDFNVSGTPQPTVKFYHDGRELRPSNNVQIEKVTEKMTETVYRVKVKKITPESAGQYTLVAQNPGGQETSSVYIAVPERRAPRFTTPLEDQTIKQGKPMVLKCQLSSPPEPNIVWTKDGVEIPDRPPHRMRYVNGEVILRMMETSPEDSGVYSVQASNEVGFDKTSCRVTIQVPGVAPRITSSRRHQERMEVPAGQPIDMEFQVTGTPHPRVKFYHNDKELKESKEVKITREETMYRLHINKATPERAGKYTLVAENEKGKQMSSLHIDVPDRTQIKPRFSPPLKDLVVQEGSPVTLRCGVSASPMPEITWTKDGAPLKNEPPYEMTFDHGHVSLRIAQAFPEDEGRYMVTAVNPAGRASTSASVRVKISEDDIRYPSAPQITSTETQELQIPAGEPVELEFKVSGTPRPRVTFYKDEEILHETEDIQIIRRDGAHVLYIRNPKPSMSGRYKVIAENERGIETAFLTIYVTEPVIRAVSEQTVYTQAAPPRYQNPPIKVEEFTDQETVTEISQIKLRVKIDGPPNAKVTWYRNGIVIPKTGRSVYEQVGQEYFLIIHKPTPEDSGLYKMVANTERGVISSECRVSVTERIPPDFIQPLDNREVEEGTTLRLECRIVGSPDPEVKWTKDDRPLVESSRIRTLKDGNVCSLLIVNFRAEDAGNYKISLSNPYGMSVSSAIIALRSFRRHSDRPAITQAPRDLNVRPGEKVEISFNIRGEPGQEVIWFKDGARIAESDTYKITTTQHKTSLLINQAKAEDSGTYSTLVKTRVGDATFVVRLHVDISRPPGVAPHFVKPFGNKKAYEGERVVFEGVITGEPEPNISWFKNGVAVEPGVYQISADNPRYSLTIAEVFESDEGVYECRAGNDYGEAVCVATLKLRGTSKPVAQYEEYSFSESTVSTWTEEETIEVGKTTVYKMPRREF